MKNKNIWLILIIILTMGGVLFFFRDSLTALSGRSGSRAQAQGNQPEAAKQTVAIRPATDINQVSAAGNIALSSQQVAVLQAEGVVKEVTVKPGDAVKPGDILVVLDATTLERAVERAKLNLAVSQNQLAQLQEPASEADIAAAQANLAASKEALAELQAGPTPTELEAAQIALAAAQESYQELVSGYSEAELTQMGAELHKAYLTLQQAQEAYNKIAYRGDAGQTQQAMDLQTATIDYDTAKAAFDIASEPASAADIQNALKNIKDAQVQLEALKATQAEIDSAEAQVMEAEASLAALLNGPSQAELEAAELAIAQSQLDLDEAQANLEQAYLRAPAAGSILTVEVEVGQQATSGLSAVTLADLTKLELPVYVAEVDISKVKLGQPVSIKIDALPDRTFSGEVSRIAPTSAADSGVVNYEVTIQLNDLKLEDGVLPGMTAVATTQGDSAENTWLAPSNSLVEFEGETTVVVIRDGQERRVTVTPGTSQGEWTVVQSAELQSGDEVVGEVSSFLNEDNGPGGFRGPFGPPPR